MIDKEDKFLLVVSVIVLVLTLVGAPTVWIVQSHFEAKSYNRLTGADATTWEAMWVELRVQDAPDRQHND